MEQTTHSSSHREAGISSVLAMFAVLMAAVLAILVLALTVFQSDDGDDSATPRRDDSLSDPPEVPGTELPEEDVPEGEGGDYCDLVTHDEANAAAGVDLPAGKSQDTPSPLGDAGSCVYMKLGADGAVDAIVNVAVLSEITRDMFEAQLAEDAPDATDIDGPGEINKVIQPGLLAVWDERDVFLNIQILTAGRAPASTDVMVAVAERALDRL